MKRYWPLRHLHHKLLAILFFLTVVPIVVIGILQIIITSNYLKSELEKGVDANVNRTAQQLNQLYSEFLTAETLFFSNTDNLFIFDSNDDDIQTQIKNAGIISAYLSSVSYINSHFKVTVAVTSPHYLTAYGLPIKTDEKLVNSLAERTKGSALHRYLTIDDVDGTKSLVWAVPFAALNDDRIVGALLLQFPYDQLGQFVEQIKVTEQVKLSLIDRYGVYFYNSDKQKIGTRFENQEVLSRIEKDVPSPFQLKDKGGSTYFYKRIGEDWILIGNMPPNEWLAPLRKAQLWILAILLAQLMMSLIIAIWLVKSFTRPIVHLTSLMSEKKSNGADIVIPRLTRDDEVKSLYEGIRELLQQIRQEQIQKKEFQLRMLHYQINPHFLYNTLDSIQWKAIEHKNKDIVEMIKNLTFLLRHGLHQTDIVTVEEELGHINSYIELQKVRYQNQFRVNVDVLSEFMQQKILKICLQPLVENAIMYAMNRKAGGTTINIYARRTGNTRMVLTVEDDGKQLDMEKVLHLLSTKSDNSSSQFGLRNVNERIKLYFGPEYGVEVNQLPGGTRFDIHLPYSDETNGGQ